MNCLITTHVHNSRDTWKSFQLTIFGLARLLCCNINVSMILSSNGVATPGPTKAQAQAKFVCALVKLDSRAYYSQHKI